MCIRDSYLGAPKTKYINFQEVQEADKLNGVITGTLDLTDPSFNVDTCLLYTSRCV